MQKLIMFLAVAFISVQSNAQFSKATLKATGLTCALCSNAINKALQAVPFIESVRSDIKNSAFTIVFKQNANVEIDDVKKAVEDAGFAVGSLQLTGTFNEVNIGADKHVRIGNANYHFLNAADQSLSGEKTITVVDKDFVTAKQYKKISSASKMSCVQTGKAASCCTKEGMTEGDRVYHVTI